MCHASVDEAKCREILQDPEFYKFLCLIDRALAAKAQAGDCPCGGKLHSARYLRKPRGAPRGFLGPDYERRLSFCCEKEGCRRRLTLPSVRFLGRRVYLGAVVVLASAMAGAVTLSGAGPHCRGCSGCRCARSSAGAGVVAHGFLSESLLDPCSGTIQPTPRARCTACLSA